MASSAISNPSPPATPSDKLESSMTTSRSAPTVNVWQTRQSLLQQQLQHTPPIPTSTTAPALSSSDGDPFIVKYGTAHAASNGPSDSGDAESWPEVGKAVTPPAATPSALEPSVPGTNGTHRRGGKKEWVPIPPSELQAAADAQRRQAQASSSRPPSSGQLGAPRNRRHPSGSRSGSASRAPSSGRPGRSGAPSNAASQAQSRAGSPPSRNGGRGRRLPGDDRIAPPLAAPPPPGPNGPFFDPSQPYAYAPYPPGAYYAPYYPPPPPPPPGGGPAMYPPPGAPVPGYPMSPDGAFSPSGFPPPNGFAPPPGPSYGYPPYPGYAYAPPYGYWPPPPPGAPGYIMPAPVPPAGLAPPSPSARSSVSALALNTPPPPPPADARPEQIPPLSARTRPPPPAQSDAIAGYREIQPVSSPMRVAATVAFGTVSGPEGARSPSPAQARTILPLAEVERALQTFSIGVTSDEPGPSSRSRSRGQLDPEQVQAEMPGSKWAFGTTSTIAEAGASSEAAAAGSALLLAPGSAGADARNAFEVHDFGYGFGASSGTGAGARPINMRSPPPLALAIPLSQPQPPPLAGRPRRGSASGGFAPAPRRGRGRGFGRGRGYGPRYPGATPPSHFTPLPGDLWYPPQGPLPIPPPNGFEVYMAPVPPAGAPTADAPGSAGVAPPMPMPQTVLPYPLDATRMYLLGQLEYYLSEQNMAADFFLRQRMDVEGWIPVDLLASFKRVRTLTPNAALVREMFAVSGLAELDEHAERVRMSGGRWQQFVLPPTAPELLQAPPVTPGDDAPLTPGDSLDEDDNVEIVVGDAGHL